VIRRLLVMVCCFALPLVTGCSDPGGSQVAPATPAQVEAQRRDVAQRLFDNAVDSLNRLGDYDEGRADSAVAQVVRRLNESLETGVLDGEKAEPFTSEDGKFLRELVWLREAARHAVGNETDVRRRAELLFDWTTRNLQLIPADKPGDERLPYLPWHLLLLGRGTSLDRGWLFLQLARQQGLDVVLLSAAESKPDPLQATVWPALLDGGQLYVFDSRLGTPLPAKDDKAIATLAAIRENDALLRALDIGDRKYPLTAAEAAKLTAYVDTSSQFLSPKFARLGRLLSGESKLVLDVDQDALVADLKKCPGVGEVKPWPLRDERFAAGREKAAYDQLLVKLLPFRTLVLDSGSRRMPSPLWTPRVRQIVGNYGEAGGTEAPLTRLFQDARPSEAELQNLRSDAEMWSYAYRVKQNATYWLALVSYDSKHYDTAVQYLQLVLKDEANGGWTTGARYNLGRCYEAAGKKSDAITAYRSTVLGVPPDDACLFRAKRLESATSAE
jgi:tetratricopeptide (TPR) repeat protein